MNINDVTRAIATVNAEIGMRCKVFAGKPQTKALKVEEMQNVLEILQIVHGKLEAKKTE